MKKTLYTLNIDNYAPEITAITYPLLVRYADKIGAKFHVIQERKFPGWPVVYEKLQIHELGRENDWNIFVDSDALVHPDFFDVTEHIDKATVMHNGSDMAGNRWRYDNYFRRDGRHIGSCNWFAVASDWCIDLWQPLDDLTLDEALKNIKPITSEADIPADHLIDDYVLSRNIAKYGLKFKTIIALQKELEDTGAYLWHQYTKTTVEKVVQLKEMLIAWNLTDVDISRAKQIDGWMTIPELKWLAAQARSFDHIVEIGSHLGRSTRALAENTSGTVTAIDDWYGPRDVSTIFDPQTTFHCFQQNMADLKGKLTPVRMDYTNLPNYNAEPDMVFIDGDHTYPAVRRDIEWALKHIKPNGHGALICGHDYNLLDVKRAVEELLPRHSVYSQGTIWYAEVK